MTTAEFCAPGFGRGAGPWFMHGEHGHRPGRRGGPPWMAGPPFWAGFGGPRGGRPRPRRGDVRLAVLTLLAEQPMHGYQIITELSARSAGVWRASPGSIYPTLQQLEDEGLVSAAEQDGRRTFTLTDEGRREVERMSAGRRAPWDELADEPDTDAARLHRRAAEVMAAVAQVATAGTASQAARAERLLTDARRALYRLLAEDDEQDEDDGTEEERD